MDDSDRTWITWFILHITITKRPDLLQTERELKAEFDELYDASGYFSNAKMRGFFFLFSTTSPDFEQHQMKIGRVRKKDGMLSVYVMLDNEKWEKSTAAELKRTMKAAMLEAAVKAGIRYKLPIENFKSELHKMKTEFGAGLQ